MKDYLTHINNLFPIRRSAEEKARFADYVSAELGEERTHIETIDKSNNVVIGDVDNAKAIITAHYDTPAASPIPNLMIPANKIKGALIHVLFPLALALLSVLVAFGAGKIFSLDNSVVVAIYLVLYFGVFFGSTRLIPNKHNKNDNTSGVAAVMSLAADYHGEKAAFILFDNEEKGLLGSKAFAKKYKDIMRDKLVINLDCVGNGDNMIFIVKDTVEKLSEYPLLCKTLEEKDTNFAVHFIPFKKSGSNSDHKSFPVSVGVMAASNGRAVRFITGRIHTSRDTVASTENIEFLHSRLGKFISCL